MKFVLFILPSINLKSQTSIDKLLARDKHWLLNFRVWKVGRDFWRTWQSSQVFAKVKCRQIGKEYEKKARELSTRRRINRPAFGWLLNLKL